MKVGKKGKFRGRKQSKPKPRTHTTHPVKGSRVVSATEAARSFSELLDRVCYRRETFMIERGGELVCEMSHVTPPRFTGDGMISEEFQDKVLDFELKVIGTDKRISRDAVFDFSIMKSLAGK